MTRRQFLSSAAVTPLAAQSAGGRPNVLFIVVDDLDCRIGCFGDPVAKTPNIDRLAARGVRFDRAYCQYPLCNPTRSSVLSGKYPVHTGVLDNNTWLILNEGEAVLPRYFERNGYATAEFGKIWHGPNRGFRPNDGLPKIGGWFTPDDRRRQQKEDPGYWDKTASPYRNMRPPEPRQYRAANNMGPLPDDDPGVDAPIADKALAQLQQMAAGGKPFFLSVGFHRPHVPLTAPKKYFDMYDPAEMRLPIDFDTEPRRIGGVPRDEFRSNIDLFSDRSFTVLEAREAMRAYYACTTYMDAQLGRLLDKLDELRLASNTIVVLFGDHGWHLSEKGMWAKGTLFETSARGPMIIAGPGKRKGAVARRVVQYVDIAPTLVDLCGLPKAAWHQGVPLTPLLDDPAAAWNRPAYTVQARSWFIGRSVRDERWRYTEWDEGRRGHALYDHDNDPNEMRNLADDPKYEATVGQLRKLLRDGPVSRDPGRS